MAQNSLLQGRSKCGRIKPAPLPKNQWSECMFIHDRNKFVDSESEKHSEIYTADEVQDLLLNADDPDQVLPKLISKIAAEETRKGAAEFAEYYNELWVYVASQIQQKWGQEIHFIGQMVRYLNPKQNNSINNFMKDAAAHYSFRCMNQVDVPDSRRHRTEHHDLRDAHRAYNKNMQVSFDAPLTSVDGEFHDLSQDIYSNSDSAFVLIDNEKSIDDKRLGQFILEKLNEQERQLVALKVFEGMSFKEIAEELGLSSSDAADKRWRRLIKKMLKLAKNKSEA